MAKTHDDTPRFRKLYPIFWDDEGIRSLDEAEQLLAAHILTCRQSNRIGLFRFSLAACAEDLGKPVATITKRFEKVCEALKWEYDFVARCLYIPSWWKYNHPENTNNMKGNLRDIRDLPRTYLLAEFSQNTTHIKPEFIETFQERMRNVAETLPNTGKQESRKAGKQEQESRKAGCSADEGSAGVCEVFAHYRTYHEDAFKIPSSASKEWKLIKARFREGYTVDDLKRAIDGNHKSPFHCGENQGGKEYHDLELIVRDGSKVNGFIEANKEPGPVLSETSRRTVRAAQDFVREFGVTDECQ